MRSENSTIADGPGLADIQQHKKLMTVWSVTFLILFPLLIVLGLLMRANQGEVVKMEYSTFYSLMTLHGLGMAGTLFSIAYAALSYLIATRYVKLSVALGTTVYFLVVAGVVGLAGACLIGKFGAGWYLLYPLPFIGASWPQWSTGLATVSLLVLGAAWLVGSLHVVLALSKKYGGFSRLMGWAYLGRQEPESELPPIALIATVSLIPGILAFLTAAAFLILFLLQLFEPSLSFNALLLKNLLFFFGHTLVNITIYLAVGWVYVLFPEFSGREWKLNRVTVYGWNATFLFILFAYFHHLYMDFAQPLSLQYIGQIASYMSAIPATAVTIFGIIAQVYHAEIRWTATPLAFTLGGMGWVIGGVAAVVDSTIAINKALHNTLWVPAHFHTYMLAGVVLFILGFLYYLASPQESARENTRAGAGFWLFVIGAYGFLAMFYLAGANSIPRRFADYATMGLASSHQIGALLAQIAAAFVVLLLVGILGVFWGLFVRLIARRTPPL